MINRRILYKINILKINKHKECWKNLLKNLEKLIKTCCYFKNWYTCQSVNRKILFKYIITNL